LYTCGKGNFGRLGHGSEDNCYKMKIVEYFRLNDIRLSDICAGGRHCLAISAPNPYLSKYEELSNRNLFVWGFNFYY
jgi:hypothetical protein